MYPQSNRPFCFGFPPTIFFSGFSGALSLRYRPQIFGLIAFVFSLAMPNIARAQSEPESLEVLNKKVSLSILQLNNFLDKYMALKCLAPISRQSLEKLKKDAAQIDLSIQSNYLQFMAIVSKQINGSGKYNASFHDMASSSNQRAKTTAALLRNISILQSSFEETLTKNFKQANLITIDDSNSEACDDEGAKGQIITNDMAESVSENIQSMVTRLVTEERRFKEFENANAGLAKNGGRISPNTQNVQRATEDPGMEAAVNDLGENRNRADISGTDSLKEGNKK